MDIKRRRLLGKLVGKAAQAGTATLEKKAREAAKRWIRPPHALDELAFLMACSRCGACIEACPEKIIFPLGAHTGAAFNTPALDLVHGACLLCRPMHCVLACEPGALKQPSADDESVDGKNAATGLTENHTACPPDPVIATVRINREHCISYQHIDCGVCVNVCPQPGALLEDMGRPVLTEACTGCAICRKACISHPKAIEVFSKEMET